MTDHKRIILEVCIPAFRRSEKTLEEQYTKKLCAEITEAAGDCEDMEISAVLIHNSGYLRNYNLTLLLRTIDTCYHTSHAVKTAETEPYQLSQSLLSTLRSFDYRSYIITYTTFNISEFKDTDLPFNYNLYENARKLLQEYGIHEVCMKITLGLKDSTLVSAIDSINRAVKHNYDMIRLVPGEELTDDMCLCASGILQARGFRQTGPGDFIKGKRPLFKAKADDEVFGFGTGACSFIDSTLLENERDLSAYLNQEEHITRAVRLDENALMKRRLVFAIGNNLPVSEEDYDFDLIQKLTEKGYLLRHGEDCIPSFTCLAHLEEIDEIINA